MSFLGWIFHWIIGYMNLGLREKDKVGKIYLRVDRVGVRLEVIGMD